MNWRCIMLAAWTLAVIVPGLSAQRTGGGGQRSAAPNVAPNPGVAYHVGDNGIGALPNQNGDGTVGKKAAEDEAKVDFQTESVLVLVPTVVTDKSGNPIRGLKAENFRVFENGKEQKLFRSEEIVAKSSQVQLKASPGVFSNLLINPQEPRAVTVIALDTINTPYMDQRYGREQLIKYLSNHIDSGQPTALVTISTRGLQVVHDFTDSTQTLIDVLKKVSNQRPLSQGDNTDALASTFDLANTGTTASTAEAQVDQFIAQGDATIAAWNQRNALETTLQAFTHLGWALSGIAGRKSVIWLTGSFPFQLESPSSVPGGRLAGNYERTFELLNQANVAIYPVDARGLVEPTGIGDVQTSPGYYGGSVRPTPGLLSARVWLHTNTLESLRQFADMTGGRAFYNRNDLTTSFQRAVEDSASYYMLSYYLDKSNRKPGWRKLKVMVDQNGAKVLARGGFFVTNSTMNADSTRDSDMFMALKSPFNATGLPIAVQLLGEENDAGHRTIGFNIEVLPDGITLEGAENNFNLDVLAEASTGKSQAAVTIAKNLRGHLPADRLAKFRSGGLNYENELALDAGKYRVRFIVRDNQSGRVGSVTAPVTVE